jgi:glycosyltransferase involved in cell wall biosynthesis
MNIAKTENNQQVDISVVVPVYGCDECLIELHNRLTNVLSSLVETYEIIFIDDSGPGNPWRLIKEIAERDNSVVGIRLSRNFGQHVAIFAGLTQSVADWVVVMDCDLQDQPEEIVKLYNAAQNKTDIVFAQRIDRQDTYFKNLTSRIFYKVLGYLTDTKLDASVANFGMYHRKVINAVLSMNEYHKIFPLMVRWTGFSSSSIPVIHASRETGKTSYTFRALLKLSVDIVLSFSDKPLRLIVKGGFIVSFLSALYAMSIIFNAIVYGSQVPGWASVMVSLWFISGALISIIGVVGLYVGKTFDESKCRPIFIVNELKKFDA